MKAHALSLWWRAFLGAVLLVVGATSPIHRLEASTWNSARLVAADPDPERGVAAALLPGGRRLHMAQASEPRPDLSPVVIEATGPVDVSRTFVATWSVVNAGTADAKPSWHDRLFLSQDAEYRPASDRYLGDVVHDEVLAVKGDYSASLKITVPNVPSGTYYLIVVVDYYNRVTEVSEGNQVRTTALRIQVPDLQPTDLLGPSRADAGESVAATWEVVNGGDGAAYASWHDRLFLSTDAEFSPATDRYLGDVVHGTDLAVKGSYAAKLEFNVPNVPAGDYFLILQVDYYDGVYERSEANQSRAVPLRIGVPDLRPTELEAVAAADAGRRVTATWSVVNEGDGAARAAWHDRLFLSSDAEFSPATDRYLGDVVRGQDLPVKGDYEATLDLTVPNVPPGSYYLVLTIDYYGNVYERSEANQVIAVPIEIRVPNLVPTVLSVPAEIKTGQAVVASWEVGNPGNAVARASWHDRLFLSEDAELSPGTDRYLGDVVHDADLAVRGSYTGSLKFTMPETPLKSYHFILVVDYYNSIYETDESDNTKARAYPTVAGKTPLIAWRTSPVPRATTKISITPPPAAKRVDVAVDGVHAGTVYGEAVADGGSLSIPLGELPVAEAGSRIGVEAHDELGRTVASAESVLSRFTEGFVTEVRIDDPPHGHRIWTDGTTVSSGTMLIRVYAAYHHVWTRENPVGPGWISGEEWSPLPEGEYTLDVLVDSVVVHTFTNGLASDPRYHEYSFPLSGMGLGDHRVSARLHPVEGYRWATDTQEFAVERRRPDLNFTREVRRAGNHFEVTLTIENEGNARGELLWLREVMTGFQACDLDSSLPIDDAEWVFSPGSRQGEIHLEFGAHTLADGATATVTYKAVPVLFRRDCAYQFGGDDGAFAYENERSEVVEEAWRTTTTRTEPWSTRRALVDAVPDALASSDYLLITDPVTLRDAYHEAEASTVLVGMAELATVRNGVLGYYHAIGTAYTTFRAGGIFGVGQTFRTWDTKDQLWVGHLGDDQVSCFADNGELRLRDDQLPFSVDLRAGDALAVGNVDPRFVSGTNYHAREEVVVAWGSGHGAADRGRVFSYRMNADPGNPDHWDVAEVPTVYDTGDRLAVGEVWSNPLNDPFDDIIIAHSDGEIWAYILTGSLFHFSSDYRTGDLFAVGDLLGDNPVEIVVGDVSANQLKVYVGTILAGDSRPTFAREYGIGVTVDEEDGLAIGDVMGDGYAEIVFADASEGRFTIYGYRAGRDRFEAIADFRLDYHADDEVACGYFSSRDKEEVLVLRGHGETVRREGTLDIVNSFDGETPGDRWALDNLMNVDGAWTVQLAPDWATDGFLLIVGENEIIPTFSKRWSIDDWERSGRVDYTDRNFASTGHDDDVNTPELSIGRIIGNTAERLVKAMGTSVELTREPWRLDNSHGYCLSGPDPDDDTKFIALRDSIADKLADRGFSTLERHLPTDTTFFADDEGRDVIFLAGHGNTTVWGSCLTQSNVFNHFDPGAVRPQVFAASCLTGRYPAGGNTLGEQFLWNGASGYIGATEVTYSWGTHGRGWSPRFAEAFYSRIASGRPVGESLKLAKRHRLSDGANTYSSDWNKNRYHCAVYHLYGDPKVEFRWTAASPALAGPTLAANGGDPEPLPGPLTELAVAVPEYTVASVPGSDAVDIPGGDVLGVTGRPAVPYYTTSVHFPKGTAVQSVSLKERSAARVIKDLMLPAVVPFTNGAPSGVLLRQAAGGWWPDRDFDWSWSRNPDGSHDLAITAFAFAYEPDSGEARYYSNYLFGITWVPTTVEIARLETDRPVYTAGSRVQADLSVFNRGEAAVDVVAEAAILNDRGEVLVNLPAVAMPGLQTWGWAKLTWDSSPSPGGDYTLEVRARDAAGHELDRRRTDFQVGQAAGAITGFVAAPEGFGAGDAVRLTATFANTGSTSLDGTVLVVVQGADGKRVTEFRGPFSSLAAGDSYQFETTWESATAAAADCRFLVYAEFGGLSTGMSLYGGPVEEPLRWDGVAVSDSQVELSWLSQPGFTYTVEYTSDLGAVPFAPIASALPATPPRNVFAEPVRGEHGYYRLRRDAAP